jgi:two-component system NtrC family sensor kinase
LSMLSATWSTPEDHGQPGSETDQEACLTDTLEPDGEGRSAEAQVAEDLDEAQRALTRRPRLSARLAIAGGFAITFLLVFVVTIAAMFILSTLKEKIRFLEDAGDLDMALLDARRAEKNFLFFGARNPAEARDHLDEALDRLRRARSIIENPTGPAREFFEDAFWQGAMRDLISYQEQLDLLVASAEEGQEPSFAEVQQVREAGRRIEHDAAAFLTSQRHAVERLVDRSLMFAVVFVAASMVIVAGVAGALTVRIIRPINLFVEYTHRIAAGDFSPVKPTRKYRDEFSNLSLAFNAMLKELGARQEELTRAGKLAALGTLTSGIAHELNNPLNNIGLTTESLRDNLGRYSTAEMSKLLDDILTQVDRAGGTVRNLLDFTRSQQPVFAPTLIPDVIRSAARLVSNEAKLSQVEMELLLPDDLPPIRACARNLEQVFLNLLLNAIQAMPRGGTLRVRAGRLEGGRVRVDVEDNGTGIAPEDLDRIFDPFFTTKEVGVGTGLGLTVSHRLIENHGGHIEVTSNPGAGTVFSVYLSVKGPAASDSESEAAVR